LAVVFAEAATRSPHPAHNQHTPPSTVLSVATATAVVALELSFSKASSTRSSLLVTAPQVASLHSRHSLVVCQSTAVLRELFEPYSGTKFAFGCNGAPGARSLKLNRFGVWAAWA
jgi:hypothetical protein